MKRNLPGTLVKFLLAGFELVFVGALVYLRVLNTGWLLIIFGLLLVVWVLFHLGLMTAFIVSLRLSPIDLLLYVAVHFFYLAAWLLQSDGGDQGTVLWTVQMLFNNAALAAFLEKWGDNLFWVASIAAFICYLLIGIVLIVRLVRWLSARKSVQPA